MPRRCSVCAHPDTLAIDTALVGGDTLRNVSLQHGVSAAALHRHRKAGHITETLRNATEAAEVANGDALLDRVQNLERRAMAILDRAEKDGSFGVALHAIREVRSTLELLAKLVGELDSGGVSVVIQSPGWVEVRAVVVTALEHHPEARAEVAAALKTFNAREPIS